MLHGTNEETAWKIAEAGFGNAVLRNEGWFGNGIYFTRSLDYSWLYSSDSPQGRHVVLAMVVPGNSLPITEHPFQTKQSTNKAGYYGAACEAGYQSHYTCGLFHFHFHFHCQKINSSKSFFLFFCFFCFCFLFLFSFW